MTRTNVQPLSCQCRHGSGQELPARYYLSAPTGSTCAGHQITRPEEDRKAQVLKKKETGKCLKLACLLHIKSGLLCHKKNTGSLYFAGWRLGPGQVGGMQSSRPREISDELTHWQEVGWMY